MSPPPSVANRLWAGLRSGLKASAFAWIMILLSRATCGPGEDSRYHVIVTDQDLMLQGLLITQFSLLTCGLLALAKPACTSRARCAMAGAGIGLADGVASAPLLLHVSVFSLPGFTFAAGLAALGTLVGGTLLWDTINREHGWRWPL